jgi:hypothetical protein
VTQSNGGEGRQRPSRPHNNTSRKGATPSNVVVVGPTQNWASFRPHDGRKTCLHPAHGRWHRRREIPNENDPMTSTNDETTKRTCLRTPTGTSSKSQHRRGGTPSRTAAAARSTRGTTGSAPRATGSRAPPTPAFGERPPLLGQPRIHRPRGHPDRCGAWVVAAPDPGWWRRCRGRTSRPA